MVAAHKSETLFKALADVTRQRLVQVLIRHELNVTELGKVIGSPQSTVSRHLRVLREAGLIRDRRKGAVVTYDAVTSNGGNGHTEVGGDLAGRILGWVADESLPKAMERRLAAVLRARQESSTTFFSRVGHRWDQMRVDCFGSAFHLEALISLLPREWTVADLGTGTGYLLPVLAAQFSRVIALDPVSAMLDVARHRPELQDAGHVEFVAGELSTMPIADGEVDLAVAALVLHHVALPSAALADLFRILKPGGKLLIVEQYEHQCGAFFEQMQDVWWGFDPQNLMRDVEAAGFGDVACKRLYTAQAGNPHAPEAPELFVMTASRPSAG